MMIWWRILRRVSQAAQRRANNYDFAPFCAAWVRFAGVGMGGFGANWEVEYLGQGRLRYAYSDGPLVDQAGTLVEPTRAQWEHFWRELSAIDVWEWAAEYLPEAQVLDSMCW